MAPIRSLEENATITTTLSFIRPSDLYQQEKPYNIQASVPVAGMSRSNIREESKEVAIRDIRGHEDPFTFERNGFEVIKCTTSVTLTDFVSRDRIETRYFGEIRNILRQRFEALHVTLFHYALRDSSESGGRAQDSIHPISYIHIGEQFLTAFAELDAEPFWTRVDETPSNIVARLQRTFGRSEALQLIKKHRVMVVKCASLHPNEQFRNNYADAADSVWRPIAGPVQDFPLTVCDTRSVHSSDCVAVTDLGALGENFWVLHNPEQRFYYLSQQTPSEIWLLKMGEVGTPNAGESTQGVPHASFRVPGIMAKQARKSIEVRAIVVV